MPVFAAGRASPIEVDEHAEHEEREEHEGGDREDGDRGAAHDVVVGVI